MKFESSHQIETGIQMSIFLFLFLNSPIKLCTSLKAIQKEKHLEFEFRSWCEEINVKIAHNSKD